jgi:hypothetical protein
MNKKINILLSLFIALLLSGCASSRHIYVGEKCITCLNNPITGKPLNHATQEKSEYQEGSVEFKVNKNVDTVLAHLMSEFCYKTNDEIKLNKRLADNGYAFASIPGVYYHMQAPCKHNYNDKTNTLLFETYIEKEGSESAMVRIFFWIEEPMINISGYGKSIKDRAMNAIKN